MCMNFDKYYKNVRATLTNQVDAAFQKGIQC
jgi:hypothetical protein